MPSKAQAEPSTLSPRLEKLPQVQSRVPFGKAHLYSLIRQNRFPAPIKIGRASFWDSSAIDAWIRDHIESNVSDKGGK